MADRKKRLDASDAVVLAGLGSLVVGLSWALSVAWALVALGVVLTTLGIMGAR